VQKRLVLVRGADYVLEKLQDVSGPGLVEAGRYRMVGCNILGVKHALSLLNSSISILIKDSIA